MSEKNVLIGKTLSGIDLAKDRQAIRFRLNDGSEIIARCDGECCSSTWIEDLINPEFAVGSEIVKAEDVELPKQFHTPTKTQNYEDSMAYYGFVVETVKGTFTLAYRNSSNGYYGGNLTWPNSRGHYGGVYDQNVSMEEWEVKAES